MGRPRALAGAYRVASAALRRVALIVTIAIVASCAGTTPTGDASRDSTPSAPAVTSAPSALATFTTGASFAPSASSSASPGAGSSPSAAPPAASSAPPAAATTVAPPAGAVGSPPASTLPAATSAPPIASVPVVARPGGGRGLAFFGMPFAGEYTLGNFHDHDVPQEFIDANGTILTFWGERLPTTSSFDGHEGYDWLMPEGTPLLAVAPGKVVIAGATEPFACPVLNNRVVAGNSVYIEHRVVGPDGEALVLRSRYSHLSRVDVEVGQQVDAGAPIGLSGNTGCSTAPHLHFEVYKLDQVSRRLIVVDPFGWEGPSLDPWATNAAGAPSLWLWATAPVLYKEVHQAANVPSGSGSVAVTGARWMGYRDDVNPNNEWVEISVDPRFAPSGSVDMTGFTLMNNRGDAYAFPLGFTARRDRPVRIHTGPGQNTDTDLYWGRASGVWDNAGDCARLVYPSGGAYTIRFTNITCTR
jgi:murein DD-endopeptidase MepM/ murein hydrolase activator NlpD